MQSVIRIADIATTPNKAGILPVSPSTIWRWVQNNTFPKPFKMGATTVWYASEIDAFVAKCSASVAMFQQTSKEK